MDNKYIPGATEDQDIDRLRLLSSNNYHDEDPEQPDDDDDILFDLHQYNDSTSERLFLLRVDEIQAIVTALRIPGYLQADN
ncbi:hypothetical protein BGZ67_005765 [Mortierella alpina]|nr:hypothetical protein BGZ67_005765 [Mortierella alpina]